MEGAASLPGHALTRLGRVTPDELQSQVTELTAGDWRGAAAEDLISTQLRGITSGIEDVWTAVLSVVHITHYILYCTIVDCTTTCVAQPMVLVHGMVFSGVGRAFYLTLCTELKCLL